MATLPDPPVKTPEPDSREDWEARLAFACAAADVASALNGRWPDGMPS